jgi:arabinan endo-1,5-alpha-L-arabinosidase
MYSPRGLLFLIAVITLVGANPASQWGPTMSRVYETTDKIPLPNQGNLAVHDPNILQYNGSYYLFKGGHHVPIFKAANMTGPWTQIGTVLDGDSVIHTGNRSRPWAPTTIERGGTFYCYYTLSTRGERKSAIGVATTTTLDGSPWTDHGAVIHTGKGPNSDVWPFTISNAIDASFITDNSTGKSYLNYGSFWHGIWQLPLSDDLLSIENPKDPDAMHLTFIPHEKVKPQEGSWMSYRDGYYYVWFSHGKCCRFQKGFPERGLEYSIRVGRSRNVRGPFVDKDEQMLLDGGGTIVYASNHGEVYAPGGIGVLPGNGSTPDILYYHYLNTSVGFTDDVRVTNPDC